MRWFSIVSLACIAIASYPSCTTTNAHGLHLRQAGLTSDFPQLTSGDGSSPTSAPSVQSSASSAGQSAAPTATASGTGLSLTANPKSKAATTAASSHPSTATSHRPTTTLSSSNATSTSKHEHQVQLPLSPRITPALSIGGVILILSGLAYALIGVKNRWIQIFLSTAYLTSLAITVLIDYVMSPPISDAIQGAYFVAIFMTGCLFGAGALVFKEITEGFGCLFGGFCVGMWFLTLKSGGLVENQTGRGILIAVFGIIAWAFSFSRYTRPYALIGSTSFGGSTAFVIGIDCFSRAGYKEFWFYLWNLNDNLFPLNTTTYPITRGIRVEIIVIVLGCIIGVMSQVKLWKVLRDKQKKRDADRHDDERRKDVVEEALGRHIEKQNDKDRANWEKQYGDRLHTKRSTILWSEANPDKRYTHISTTELPLGSRSSSSESLEMTAFGPRKQPLIPSTYGIKGKHRSTTTVDVIMEEEENMEGRPSMERLKALAALEEQKRSPRAESVVESVVPSASGPAVIPLPFTIPTSDNTLHSEKAHQTSAPGSGLLEGPKRDSKRLSWQSLLSVSARPSSEILRTSASQEALVPPGVLHSRPSSIAATIDDDHDRAEMYQELAKFPSNEPQAPKITISPAGSYENLAKKASDTRSSVHSTTHVPTSPSAMSFNFELEDPEELARPVQSDDSKAVARGLMAGPNDARPSTEPKRTSTSDGDVLASSESYDRSQTSTAPTSTAEDLTKGALANVPSQLSNVVMSYRTNEWAKHISVADEPMFDEPENVESQEVEAPIHIAPPSPPAFIKRETQTEPSETMSDSPSLLATSRPPAPHLMPSTHDADVVALARPPERSKTDELIEAIPRRGVVAPQRSLSAQTAPAARPVLKKQRSSTLKQGAMNPIDENMVTEFRANRQSTNRSSVAVPNRVYSSNRLSNASQQSLAMTQAGVSTPNLLRSSSYNSISDMNLHHLSRTSSILSNVPATRSSTRLDSYDSHQPSQRDVSNDAVKRENMLAEWRMSQQLGAVRTFVPQASFDAQRQQMMVDREQKRMVEEHQKTASQQKQFAIDQVMRRPDMQELHREAMRKMQAGASKKL